MVLAMVWISDLSLGRPVGASAYKWSAVLYICARLDLLADSETDPRAVGRHRFDPDARRARVSTTNRISSAACRHALFLSVAVYIEQGQGKERAVSGIQNLLEHWRPRLLVGAVTLCWANLHGSFAIGPVTIGMIGLGSLIDSLRNRDEDELVTPQGVIRETTIVLAISLFAGLFNPYGIALYREVVTFSASPNLYRFIEWKPLWFTPKQGTLFAIASVFALCSVAFSKQSLRWRDWLPVIVLAAMTLKTSRYIVWFAPLYVNAMAPYFKCILDEAVSRSESLRKLYEFSHRRANPSGSLIISMCAVAVVLLSRSFPYGSRTPIDVTEKLRELPPQKLILNTMEWGDWMIWRSRGSLPIFVNSHATFIPPDIWEDYITLSKLRPGWEAALAKYPFSAAVLQKGRQRRLIGKLDADPAWKVIYQDEIAVLYLRSSEK